jgi:hypothetical protein
MTAPPRPMLRCRRIDSDEKARSVFHVTEPDAPASIESLERVTRIAELLLRENDLPGRFLVAGPGLVALELSEGERTFFHNGIVFAALDAYNDPVRNPTLTLSADDPR